MDRRKRLWTLFVVLVLGLLTLGVFWQVQENDFLSFDDPVYVTENTQVQSGLNSKTIAWSLFSTHANFWHPLTTLSHAWDCQFYGLNPEGHHRNNLYLHIGNVLLLFWILKAMTGSLWPSGFVAALFAIHPLHVESVAWVSQRKDLLSTLFWILTMGAYLRYVRSGCRKANLVLVLVSFALGLMSKPMLVTLPVILLALDYWPLQRWQMGVGIYRKLLLEKIPLFAMAGIGSFVAFIVQKRGGALPSLSAFPFEARIGNALHSVCVYLMKAIWPAGLSIFYPHLGREVPLGMAAGCAMVLAILCVLVVWQAKKRPYLLTGWLWFIITLVPVSGLIQVGMHGMADRYTYVPLIGIFLMMGWGGAELIRRWPISKPLAWGFATMILGLFMITSMRQVGIWRDSVGLFQHAVRVTVPNAQVHNLLGNAYIQQDRFQEAIGEFQEALRIGPSYAEIHHNLGNALAGLGRLEEAKNHYAQALRIKPGNPDTHNNLGIVLAREGRLDEAIAHYSRAIAIDSSYGKARNNIQIALAKKRGTLDSGVNSDTLNPQQESEYNQGLSMARQGKWPEAIAHFSTVVRWRPDFAPAYYNLGVSFAKAGRLQEARRALREALRCRSDFLPAKSALQALEQSKEAE